MVKTAVLMATYNGSQFIEKQLDSIRKQTLAPDYVLMRDDCSTDDTVEVVKNYIQKYNLSGWSIQRNASNLGWRLNFRQLMLDVVSYDVDYVFFSDQDDIWYLDKNERQVTVMEERQDIDLLSADIDIEVRSDRATVPDQFQFDEQQQVSSYPNIFTYRTYRPGWTFCLRKLFSDIVVSYWKEGDQISHDNLTSIAAAMTDRAANMNVKVGSHIRYENNASGNKKYVFTIKSSKQKHIEGLYVFYRFYEVIAQVASYYRHDNSKILTEVSEFYKERYEVAHSNKVMENLFFVISHLSYYENMNAVARDLIFSFKK
ncbi:glycosyltransferase [Streptococcus suis]|uniref:glycosyltransferase n=1 Tax=Streptococcus suis TaxID=1307 RepID=UPI001ABDCFB3|nr:glycosyltransferase [Streptococcus suis]